MAVGGDRAVVCPLIHERAQFPMLIPRTGAGKNGLGKVCPVAVRPAKGHDCVGAETVQHNDPGWSLLSRAACVCRRFARFCLRALLTLRIGSNILKMLVRDWCGARHDMVPRDDKLSM